MSEKFIKISLGISTLLSYPQSWQTIVIFYFSVKSDGLVDEYALSQTTLEQVFLQFARQQEENEEMTMNEDRSSHL